MMMNYHSRDRRKKRTKWIVIFLLVFLLFFYSQITGFFSNVFHLGFYSFWKSENTISENTLNPFSFLSTKKSLITENESLRDELNKAQVQVSQTNLLLKENLELKEIMGRMDNREYILASILTKPSNSEYDIFIIDLGREDVKVGDIVLADGNIVIGEIVEVDSKTSKVKLYSSPKENVNVNVGLYNVQTVAIGKGNGNFEAEVPRGVFVEIGDPVYTTGLNAPLFGNIEEIISSPADSFKTLLFKSPINISELKWVQILK